MNSTTTDLFDENTSMEAGIFYPGSYSGFVCAGLFFLTWGFGTYASFFMTLIPSYANKWRNSVCRGRVLPMEGIFLCVLGFCGFISQLIHANSSFYDASIDSFRNQNNLRDGLFYFGLGNAGLIYIICHLKSISDRPATASLVMSVSLYILSLSFKANTQMTSLDYTIMILQILTFAGYLSTLVAELIYKENILVLLCKSLSLMLISIWYLQTANIYWGYGNNSWQTRLRSDEYTINTFTAEVVMMCWVFGGLGVWLFCHHSDPVTESHDKKFVSVEEELSVTESERVEVELIKHNRIVA